MATGGKHRHNSSSVSGSWSATDAGKSIGTFLSRSGGVRFDRRVLPVLTFVCAVILFAGYLAALASDVGAVRDSLYTGKGNLETAYLSSGKADFKNAAQSFQLAQSNFVNANKVLAGSRLKPLSFIPIVSDNLSAIKHLTNVGLHVSLSGDSAMKALACFPQKNGKTDIGFSNGTIDIASFVKARPFVERAHLYVLQAAAEYEKLPSAPGTTELPQIKSAREEFSRQLPKLKDAIANTNLAVAVLPDVLGASGKRGYFLAIQNNAELRATGGLIGNYGVLTIDKGRVQLAVFDEIERIQGLNQRAVNAPQDFVSRYGKFKSTSMWANANMSPDFPTVSKVLLNLYRDVTGVKLDGIISIDPVGLAYLLEAVGPATIPQESIVVDSKNAVELTLVDAYSKYSDRGQRKDFLADLARGVWGSVIAGQIADKSKLIDQLKLALDEKHMAVYSIYPEEQELAESLGYASALIPTAGDYAMVIMQNHGANKVDVYIHEKIGYRIDLQRDGSARARLEINLTNETPTEGLPPYVLGENEIGMKDGVSNMWLNVYVPKESRLVAVGKGDGKFDIDKEKDKTVFSQHIKVAPGTNETSTLSYSLPDVLTFNGDTAKYSLDWQIQPVINNPVIEINVKAPDGFEFKTVPGGFKKKGNSAVFSGVLSTDQKYEFILADNT